MLRSSTLLDKVVHHAEATPHKKAFIQLDNRSEAVNSYSYAELRQLVTTSGRIVAPGTSGQRPWCLLLFQNSFQFLPYFLAAIQQGTIPCTQEIPNSPYKMGKLISKIRKYAIERVLVQKDIFDKKWFQKLLSEVPPEYRGRFIEAIAPLELPDAGLAKAPEAAPIAFVQFTSGTTKEARAIGISHQNLLYAIERLSCRVGRTADSVSINWLPHYHDLGLIDGLLTGLYLGASTYLMEGTQFITNPLSWLTAMSRYRITHTSAPNFAYDLCVDRYPAQVPESLDLSGVSSFILGGEMVKVRTLQRFSDHYQRHGLNPDVLVPGYGMAETTLAICCQSPGPLHSKFDVLDDNKVVSCGALFEGSQVEIRDEEGGRLDDHHIGTIYISGTGVASHFQEGEFRQVTRVKTGDIGFMAGDQLYLVGREGDLMIKNGQNYALSELEDITSTAHEAIHTSGVVALLNIKEDFTENFEMAVELKRGLHPALDYHEITSAIRTTLSRTLGLFPDRITLLGYWKIPRTSSGKKQKKKLREQLAQATDEPLFVNT